MKEARQKMNPISAVSRALAFCIALISSCADRVAAQTYDDLVRYPDRFAGYRVQLTGKVIQSLQDDAAYALRVNITSGPQDRWTDTVWIDFRTASPQRILEGDVIRIIGTFQGMKSYKAVLGQTIQLPYIVACDVVPFKPGLVSAPRGCFLMGTPGGDTNGLYKRDEKLCQSGDDAEAIAACSNLLNRGSSRVASRVAAFVRRGTLLMARGDRTQAMKDFTEAAAWGSPDAYAGRGALYSKMGDFEGAFQDSTKALRLDPNNPLAAKTLGEIGRRAVPARQKPSDSKRRRP
jgi:tetratricopeptide (TPR) repeat protein